MLQAFTLRAAPENSAERIGEVQLDPDAELVVEATHGSWVKLSAGSAGAHASGWIDLDHPQPHTPLHVLLPGSPTAQHRKLYASPDFSSNVVGYLDVEANGTIDATEIWGQFARVGNGWIHLDDGEVSTAEELRTSPKARTTPSVAPVAAPQSGINGSESSARAKQNEIAPSTRIAPAAAPAAPAASRGPPNTHAAPYVASGSIGRPGRVGVSSSTSASSSSQHLTAEEELAEVQREYEKIHVAQGAFAQRQADGEALRQRLQRAERMQRELAGEFARQRSTTEETDINSLDIRSSLARIEGAVRSLVVSMQAQQAQLDAVVRFIGAPVLGPNGSPSNAPNGRKSPSASLHESSRIGGSPRQDGHVSLAEAVYAIQMRQRKHETMVMDLLAGKTSR